MVRFKILGQELKLPENFNISFSSNNPIFNFENIQLIRTQSFFVPSNAENDSLLGFAGRHDRFGDMARRIINAELIYSCGKIDGRFYIDEFNDGYSCVFVFGELLKLKEIKESGEIAKYLILNNTILWADGQATFDPVTILQQLGLYKYSIYAMEPNISAGWNFLPTVSLNYLLESCKNYFGVDVNLGSYLDKIKLMGIKLNGLNDFNSNVVPQFTFSGNGSSGNNFDYIGYESVFYMQYMPANWLFSLFTLKMLKIYRNYTTRLQFILPAREKYPALEKETFLLVFSASGVLKIMYGNITFANKNYDIIIDLEEGDSIATVTRTERYATQYDPATVSFVNTNISVTCDVMRNGGNIEYGDIYPLQQNLPALTFIDLLQIIAKTTETAILYDETTNEISFFEFDNWLTPINISEKLLKKGSLLRRFSNFAQKSIVKFANSEKVQVGTENEDIFYLQNESIEKEKVIHEIKLSGGGKNKDYGIVSTAKKLILGDIERIVGDTGQVSYKFGTDKDTLVEWDVETSALRPVEFVKNTQLREMVQKSTIIKRDVEMTLNEYLNVKHNSTFLIDGIVYAWFSRKWSKNVASFELQKK